MHAFHKSTLRGLPNIVFFRLFGACEAYPEPIRLDLLEIDMHIVAHWLALVVAGASDPVAIAQQHVHYRLHGIESCCGLRCGINHYR